MSGKELPERVEWGSIMLCMLLSLLLHAGLAWALDWLPPGMGRRPQAAPARTLRHVQVLRAAPKVAQERPAGAQEAPRPPEAQAPFAKTEAEAPQRRPEQADFVGARSSVASGEDEGPRRRSEAPLPSMAGRESEEEIVTFDQERQDGDPAHEGRQATTANTPPAAPSAAPATPLPPQPVAEGRPDGGQGEPEGEGAEAPQPASAATAARQTAPTLPGEGLLLGETSTPEDATTRREQPPPAALGQPGGSRGQASPTRPQRPALYDPTLAPGLQQPGLRTHERRTRSTGRFVFGSRPALNVEATARGRYEAEVYRRIARMWYAACDEHRGDIIPGSITISLRLTKRGSIDSMQLMRRRGASMLQQSFSFAAIRHATLPPMPREVQQELIGELHELILTFHFDG